MPKIPPAAKHIIFGHSSDAIHIFRASRRKIGIESTLKRSPQTLNASPVYIYSSVKWKKHFLQFIICDYKNTGYFQKECMIPVDCVVENLIVYLRHWYNLQPWRYRAFWKKNGVFRQKSSTGGLPGRNPMTIFSNLLFDCENTGHFQRKMGDPSGNLVWES